MSRLKNYASALGSSYLALGAYVASTLISVPLALKYLSKPEFALWGLTLQIAGYIALIDFGMAGASRILIDHKDRKDEPTYGSVIQTTVAVSLVQALLIAAGGVVLAFGLGNAVRVPEAFHHEFVLLMLGQCGLLAGTFMTRIFTFLLSAHQRQDVLNYTNAISYPINLAVLWLCFELGAGVFSTIWAQLAGWLLTNTVTGSWCFRLHLFPHSGCWGRPSWARFSELFAYGRDIFLILAGWQLINASQIILITRQLGLEAAAIWVICTRSYTIIVQVIYRIFDNSCPALAEIIVRRDTPRLLYRFRSIVVVSASAAVFAGVVFALCNQPFVRVWTDGKASWPVTNDILLAVALVISVIVRCHVGLTGQTKELRMMRFVPFLEGLWLAGLSLPVLRWSGVAGMLLVAITGTLLVTFPYSTWRTANYFQLPWSQVAANWSWPTMRLALLLAPIASIIYLSTRPLSPLLQLILNGVVAGAVGAWLLARYGLNSDLRQELSERLPTSLLGLITRLPPSASGKLNA